MAPIINVFFLPKRSAFVVKIKEITISPTTTAN